MLEPGNRLVAELHAIISSLKAVCTWETLDCQQECREACGGLGFSYYAKIAHSRSDYDVNTTWEGDNNVLIQQTAKYVLEQYKAKMKNKSKKTNSFNWVKANSVNLEKCMAKTAKDFLNPDNLLFLFEHRCNYLMQLSGYKLDENIQSMGDPWDAWNATQPFYLKDLALAVGELFVVQEYHSFLMNQLTGAPNPDTAEALNLCFQIYCLTKILKDIGTFREHDFLTTEHYQIVRDCLPPMYGSFTRHVGKILDSFYPPEEMMDSFLAPTNGDLYGHIVDRLMTAPKTFERHPNWKSFL